MHFNKIFTFLLLNCINMDTDMILFDSVAPSVSIIEGIPGA